MSDDQNTTQNPIPEENSISISPQEPMADIPVSAPDSTPADMPLEAPETPINADIPVSLNNDNTQNEPISTPSSEEAIPLEPTDMRANPASNGTSEPSVEPVFETRTASADAKALADRQMAQFPVNEPLVKISLARELLVKARNMIQFRKRKKLDRVMTLFLKQPALPAGRSKITNNEVKDFLHVSDATAERYLNTLEKENKIKQVGKTGKGVSYSPK